MPEQYPILTCFQNGPVDHSGTRCQPGRLTIQHDHWIGVPRIENGVPEFGGVCVGRSPNEDAVLYGLRREVPAGNWWGGRVLLDDERVHPDIDSPWTSKFDRGGIQRRMTEDRAGQGPHTKVYIETLFEAEYVRYRGELKKLYRKHAPGANFGIYGFPLFDRPIDDPKFADTYRMLDYAHCICHYGQPKWTERHIQACFDWDLEYPHKANTPRLKPLMQFMVTPNVDLFIGEFKKWESVFEGGLVVPYLWGDARMPEMSRLFSRVMREFFPAGGVA